MNFYCWYKVDIISTNIRFIGRKRVSSLKSLIAETAQHRAEVLKIEEEEARQRKERAFELLKELDSRRPIVRTDFLCRLIPKTKLSPPRSHQPSSSRDRTSPNHKSSSSHKSNSSLKSSSKSIPNQKSNSSHRRSRSHSRSNSKSVVKAEIQRSPSRPSSSSKLVESVVQTSSSRSSPPLASSLASTVELAINSYLANQTTSQNEQLHLLVEKLSGIESEVKAAKDILSKIIN